MSPLSWGCSSVCATSSGSLSPYPPLSALPTSSLQQLSSEHCPALGAAALLLSELSWARQIHPGACKQCQRAATCFGQSREFAVRGCSGNVTVQDPKGLPPPPPHCQGHQGVCNASSTWVKTLTESSIHPSIRPSLRSSRLTENIPAMRQQHHACVWPPSGLQSITWHYLSVLSTQKSTKFLLKGAAGTQLSRSWMYELLAILCFQLLSTLQHLIPNSLLQPAQKVLSSSSLDF